MGITRATQLVSYPSIIRPASRGCASSCVSKPPPSRPCGSSRQRNHTHACARACACAHAQYETFYLSACAQGAGSTQPGPHDQTAPPLSTRRPSSTRAAACKEIPATLAPTPSTTPTTSAPQVSLESPVMAVLSHCTPRLRRRRRRPRRRRPRPRRRHRRRRRRPPRLRQRRR